MTRDLSALGLAPHSTVLVHASLSSLGHVEGGAPAVIRALIDVLGPRGTILMPALSYEAVSAASPVFDVRSTPSNVGRIAETFRSWRGVRRSVHPTHSVCALGPRVSELLDGHDADETPCGPHSPFRRNALTGGSILFLGCGLGPNTTMHAVEEMVEPPYLFGDTLRVTVTGWDGVARKRAYRMHGFGGVRQRYERVQELMVPPALVSGSVLAARSYLVRADLLWDRALEALRRDPLCFVELDFLDSALKRAVL